MNEYRLKQAIVRVARRLDQKGILTSTDGNLSARLDDGGTLITPSGCCKGELEPDQIVRLFRDGSARHGRPSSEIALHQMIYARRPDVRAIIHAHPPYATAYAVAGIPLDQPILSEAILTLGRVPVASYAMPTAEELATGREALRTELLNERRNRFYAAYMTKARDRMKVTINRELIAQLVT